MSERRGVATDVSAERLERFFTPEPGGGYRVNQESSSCVVFARYTLLTNPPLSRLDLPACRNMLVYFERERGIQLVRLRPAPQRLFVFGRELGPHTDSGNTPGFAQKAHKK